MSALVDLLRANSKSLPTNGPEIAAEYARKGFHVTPVAAPIKGDHYSGKNANVGGPGWWDNADDISTFAPSRYKGLNVGICGGYELDEGWLFVLDCDGSGGLSELAAIQDKHGQLPPTFTVKSGSGTGKHYYFRTKKQYGGKNLAGSKFINTRGKGGQVVAPGCYHYSGNQYVIEMNTPIAWAPEWLETLLGEARNYESKADVSLFRPVILTREMCAEKANRLGPSHGAHSVFDMLAKGLPLAGPGEKHELVDLRALKIMVGEFGPGITADSVLLLLAPTYPLWSVDPLGPGRDNKNWNDVLAALDGAKSQYDGPAELTTPTLETFKPTHITKDVEFDLAVEHCREQAEIIGRSTANGAAQRKAWWRRLAHEDLSPIPPHELALMLEMVLKTYPTATESSIGRLLHPQKVVRPEDIAPIFKDIRAKTVLVQEKVKNKLALYNECRVVVNEEGKPFASAANVSKLVRAEMGAKLRLNVRTLSIECRDLPWCKNSDWHKFEESSDLTKLGEWFQDRHGMLAPNGVYEAVAAVAEDNQVDPFVDFLNTLPAWDTIPRLDSWLMHALGVEDSVYTRAIGAKFILSIVARALLPGCKVDTKLILVGGQGQFKSTLLRALVPAGFFDSTPKDPKESGKDYLAKLHRFVIHEDAEMDAYSQSDIKSDKAMITNQIDTFRKPYAKSTGTFPRRFVLCGSTNEEEGFLRDSTGARRYWPLRVGKVGLIWMRENAIQLWAEALERFKKFEPLVFSGNELPVETYAWWLEPTEELEAKEVQKEHEEEDPWQSQIEEYLAREWGQSPPPELGVGEWGWIRKQVGEDQKLQHIQASQLLQLLGAPAYDRRNQRIVASILKKLGWKLGLVGPKDKRVKMFRR